MTETKTEVKSTYASEHESRIAVTNALLLPNVIRVWWSYEHWNKEPGSSKPYTVTVETILKEPEYDLKANYVVPDLSRRLDNLEADMALNAEKITEGYTHGS